MSRLEIAEKILGRIDGEGFCRCPGEAHHTNLNAPRDCKVFGLAGGAPTILCMHQSCAGAVDDANYKLRSEIGRAEKPSHIGGGNGNYRPKKAASWGVPARSAVIDELALEAEELSLEAEAALPGILQDFEWNFEDSAEIPDNPEAQFAAFLGLWKPTDHVWIGWNTESGEHVANPFARPEIWLRRGLTDRCQTSPWAFRPGSRERTKANAIIRRYLVFESDTLPAEGQKAVLNYLRRELELSLKMVVYTGGKSFHGWFDVGCLEPSEMTQLKAIMTGARPVTQTPRTPSGRGWHTGLSGDPAMFVASQPVRLPGPINPKTQLRQTICWLS